MHSYSTHSIPMLKNTHSSHSRQGQWVTEFRGSARIWGMSRLRSNSSSISPITALKEKNATSVISVNWLFTTSLPINTVILSDQFWHHFINIINPSPPSASYMRQWIGSALVEIMACRLFGAKPLSQPTLGYCQVDSWEHISVKFEYEFYHFHSRKC